MKERDEEKLLRSVTLQNATEILQARMLAEQELVRAKEELQSTAEQLARSVAALRATLEATVDGILVTDDRGRVTAFNSRFIEMWRIPPEIAQAGEYTRIIDVCADQMRDPAGLQARTEALYAAAPPETHDLLELADGRMYECFSRLQCVAGNPTGRVWSFRDITEQKRMQEATLRLAAIVECSDDAIVSKTLDGIITTWNQGAERMFGYRADEVIGKPITILIPPDLADEETHILNRLRRGERIDHYETRRRRKDGSLLTVTLSVSPLRDAEGRIFGASKIARDMTARKRAEEALRDESRALELLNWTGIVIASTLDLQKLLQVVTDAATQISGAQFGAFFHNQTDASGQRYSLYTLAGAPREALEHLGYPRATPLFGPTFRGEGPIRSGDIQQDPRYGQMPPHFGMPAGHLPVRSYLAVPVVSRSREVIGGLFLGHPQPDIFTERTERIIVGIAAQAAIAVDNARLYEEARRAAEERSQLLEAERAARGEAERVSRMKDEFLANLSHELRTPLNAILGWSQLLMAGTPGGADLKEGLETISRNARVQTQLIEDLLDMSRIISGKIRLEVEPTDLAAVVDAAIGTVQPSIDAKNIRLRKVFHSQAGPVSGDPARLQQVVWNLLSNAVKFTPKGGSIDIVVQRINSSIEVIVKDSGQGISPEFLPHVFERFRQADASTTRKFGGLGLGLAIVKQLVELHGGTIRAESEGEGKGSCFIFSLPVAPVRGLEMPRRLDAHTADFNCYGFDLDGVTVLLVDDEPDTRALIRRILIQCKCEVLTAASADEGLVLLKSDRPDVLISDIGLPDKDGYGFLREVRNLPADQGGRVPAIALTAFARSEDRTRAMFAGYQVHIAKPIEPQELIATLASLTGRTGNTL